MRANELARAVTTLRATTPPAWIPTAPVSAEHNTVTLHRYGLFGHDGEFSHSTDTSCSDYLCLNNRSKVRKQSVRRVNGSSPRVHVYSGCQGSCKAGKPHRESLLNVQHHTKGIDVGELRDLDKCHKDTSGAFFFCVFRTRWNTWQQSALCRCPAARSFTRPKGTGRCGANLRLHRALERSPRRRW